MGAPQEATPPTSPASRPCRCSQRPLRNGPDEARAILAAHLEAFRRRSHAELVGLMGDVQVAEVNGPSGAVYQIEVEVVWDSPREQTDIRVLGAIDDGRLPGAIVPVTDDFIVVPDGSESSRLPLQWPRAGPCSPLPGDRQSHRRRHRLEWFLCCGGSNGGAGYLVVGAGRVRLCQSLDRPRHLPRRTGDRLTVIAIKSDRSRVSSGQSLGDTPFCRHEARSGERQHASGGIGARVTVHRRSDLDVPEMPGSGRR